MFFDFETPIRPFSPGFPPLRCLRVFLYILTSLTSSKSFTIRTSETPFPQLLYNPHLQAPLGSAGNRGLVTPLESALTRNSPATPLESPLTKTGGGVLPGVHSRSSLLSFAGDSTWPMQRLSLRGLGGSSELRRLWDAGASDHLCEFARRGRPARASRTARCRVRASPARWSILCRVVGTRKVRKLVTNRDSHLLRRCRVMRRQRKRDGEVNSPLQNGGRAALKDRVYTGTVGSGTEAAENAPD